MLAPTLAVSCVASILSYYNYKYNGISLLVDGIKDIIKHGTRNYSDRVWSIVYAMRDVARNSVYIQRIAEINHYRLLPVDKFTKALSDLGPYMVPEQGGTCVGLSDAGDRFLCIWGDYVVDTGIKFNELRVSGEQYLTATERINGLISTIKEQRESKERFLREQRARRSEEKV